MSRIHRLIAVWILLLAGPPSAPAQTPLRVSAIEVKFIGPPGASEELVRANIRTQVGDPYTGATEEDVRNLYATGFFRNIQVVDRVTPEGVVLTYLVQGKPRLTAIKFEGNTKFTDQKLLGKLVSKIGQPMDDFKFFTDVQEIKKMYEKKGYLNTGVRDLQNIDENAGTGTVLFEIKEAPKVRIEEVQFIGAEAFKQKQLRKVIKTRSWWMFSWLTGSGTLKDDELQDDREKLTDFYRSKGYIDFAIRDIIYDYPSTNRLILRWVIFEGKPYKVGDITLKGNLLFPTNILYNMLPMKIGNTFTPAGASNNLVVLENFYGARGYIDVNPGSRLFQIRRVPNVTLGTMDIVYDIDASKRSYIEKIEIRGNTKTKDRVIRRELAVSPGETFDMVRVKLSKIRLEGLNYFSKVETRPEPSEAGPERKNLIVGVEEKNTGNISIGAGFSSIDSIVGFVEVTQGNFDLFNPPTFTGGGQKARLRLQLGTERQDYVLSFIEPWFLGRKLSLGVEFYYRDLNYLSPNDVYTETLGGGKVTLTRALWSDYVIGAVSYKLERIGIDLNPGWFGPRLVTIPGSGPFDPPITIEQPGNVPPSIVSQVGNSLLSEATFSLAYDTRKYDPNWSGMLPMGGQRTELVLGLAGGILGGDQDFYKWDLRSSWYFKGLLHGHVVEVIAGTGVANGYDGRESSVPFYEKYYLGGMYTLRGFEYREISPRDPGYPDEPVGGNTYWFGSVEYSIPIIERLRIAAFYDVGDVAGPAYRWNTTDMASDWGFGIRLNLPIGPLRLDYAIPIKSPAYVNGSGGQFQFGVGYTREF